MDYVHVKVLVSFNGWRAGDEAVASVREVASWASAGLMEVIDDAEAEPEGSIAEHGYAGGAETGEADRGGGQEAGAHGSGLLGLDE